VYDKDNIPMHVMKNVKKIIGEKSEFNVNKIAQTSKIASGLAKWCLAALKYSDISLMVKQKLTFITEL
jgi:hypothetical protein